MKKGNEFPNEPDKIAKEFKIHPEWRYQDLPLVDTGCDSYASWHPGFKSLSPMMGVEQILDEVEIARKGDRYMSQYLNSKFGLKNAHIVITGGEPLLGWQKQYPELLDSLGQAGYRNITFETNGTQEICDELHDYLMLNHINGKHLNITFSISPKLPSSGEKIEKTLKPGVVDSYSHYGTSYLKFVIDKNNNLSDVNRYIKEYKQAGFSGEIYFMPCGGNYEMYIDNAPAVAQMAINEGVRYSPRLQVDLYQNRWGT